MNFLKFILEQAFTGIVVILLLVVANYISIDLGFSEIFTMSKKDTFLFYIVYTLVGATLRYVFQSPPKRPKTLNIN